MATSAHTIILDRRLCVLSVCTVYNFEYALCFCLYPTQWLASDVQSIVIINFADVRVAVPLRRSIGSEIDLLRPPPLLTSSAHTFTVSPSPNVLLVVGFNSRITAPETK